MLFSATLVAAIAGSALATPLKRADSLSVKVTGPSGSVNSVKDLKFTAEVTNNGAEPVKVLKYGTVLDSLPTRSFTVTKDGQPVKFSGVKLFVSSNNENAYTTIESGRTVSVAHDVSSLFDFASAGVGRYSFQPITDLRVAGVDEQATHPAALALVSPTSEAIEVEVTGDLGKREWKRATTTCEDPARASFIDASYTESKELARVASRYVSSAGASDPLFTAYFGENSVSNVMSVFDGVANEDDSSRTLSCTDDFDACDDGTIAYTYVETTNIYYCDAFFDEVPTNNLCSSTTVEARNIRGGTTLHEMTHALSDTDDVMYGCPQDQALSDSDKIINADNYNVRASFYDMSLILTLRHAVLRHPGLH
ncbi:deuterolysin m35 metalloprotease [Moniliophthora roreri MCA 2997]|uniref:Neutral protease 2 n=1 Tax=Moniliophthora roreri (strain MCA 2997) TaxID=1381753 RepID=V2WH86_MONRO|nr:deuterolysin m35 metalloprotease [Moniliophthora roreri MCA 2997]